ncbi:MAG: methionine--tRNA ligase [Patescibacteria group bacterium]
MKNKFYITTPIYYVNAKPHIGHAYTTVATDTLARFHKTLEDNTFFLTGTDEHGLKIQKKAQEAGKEPQDFVNEISQEFKNLWDSLGIEYSNFIRTTDAQHKETVRKVLQALYDKGAIYKGEYEGLYCVGCEQFLHEKDLIDGKCPDHNQAPEKVKEESYLMKMTEIQGKLIEKIENNELEIAPERYKNEILSFLKGQKLEDVSISRKNVSWGIPLPFDESQTTYVWVDAFLNYLTGLGWDGNLENMPEKWPADVQLIGKDILRVHATIWPAILLHLGFPLPKKLFVHGHILSGGKKMSKTLGNVIGIDEMIEKFGKDGTRYLLLSAGTFGEDVDVTMERMVEKYNADLANGIGNLVSRVIKMSQDVELKHKQLTKIDISSYYSRMDLGLLLNFIWNIIRSSNVLIDKEKPWELKKTDEAKFKFVMEKLISDLYQISELLEPFLPETSEKIKKALLTREVEPLFQRIR